MKATWLFDCGRGGRSNFTSAKKRSSGRKDPDTLVVYAVANAPKINIRSTGKARYDSDLYAESKHSNF